MKTFSDDKFASQYKRGIDFIAFNDEVDELNTNRIAGFISVITLSETLQISTRTIARDVAWLRKEAR